MRIVVRLVQLGVVALLAAAVFLGWRGTRDGAARPAADLANAGEKLVLGPAGVGKLRLGMSDEEANATVYVFIFHVGGGTPAATAKLQLTLLSLREQDQECTTAG